jgi:hypothetical protein
MRIFSLPALVVAAAYAALVSTILRNAAGDAEEISFTWLAFGFPGIFFTHAWHGWAAIALNAAVIYAGVALLIPAYKKYSRPPD